MRDGEREDGGKTGPLEDPTGLSYETNALSMLFCCGGFSTFLLSAKFFSRNMLWPADAALLGLASSLPCPRCKE